MKNLVFLILSLVVMSCSKTSKLLPVKYELEKGMSSTAYLFQLSIYNVTNNDVLSSDLLGYPSFKVSSKYTMQKWTRFDSIYDDEQKRLSNIIQETYDIGRNEYVLPLIKAIKDGKEVYFASVYTEEAKDPSGDSFRLYDEMFFLDIDNRKIYEFEYIHY